MMELEGQRLTQLEKLHSTAPEVSLDQLTSLSVIEGQLKELQTNFLRVVRSHVRELQKLKPEPCGNQGLFALPHKFYVSKGLVVYSALHATADIAAGKATLAATHKRFVNYCRAIDLLRQCVVKLGPAVVPMCCVVEQNGVSYLVQAIDDLSPELLEHAVFPKGGQVRSKDPAVATLLSALTAPEVAIPSEALVVFKKTDGGHYVTLLHDHALQLKSGMWAREELFDVREQKTIECCEAHEPIEEGDKCYLGHSAKYPNYVCCVSCYRELGPMGQLKVRTELLKESVATKYLPSSFGREDPNDVPMPDREGLKDWLWHKLRNVSLDGLINLLNSGQEHLLAVSEASVAFHSRGINLDFLGHVYTQVRRHFHLSNRPNMPTSDWCCWRQ